MARCEALLSFNLEGYKPINGVAQGRGPVVRFNQKLSLLPKKKPTPRPSGGDPDPMGGKPSTDYKVDPYAN